MTLDEVKGAVLSALSAVAPEIDPATIQPGVSFRDQLDLDSVDFLNFVVGLHRRLGVTVPETDYGKLATLDSTAAYLLAKLAAAKA